MASTIFTLECAPCLLLAPVYLMAIGRPIPCNPQPPTVRSTSLLGSWVVALCSWLLLASAFAQTAPIADTVVPTPAIPAIPRIVNLPETAPRAQASPMLALPAPPPAPITDFQKFVAETVGKPLPYFGANFFNSQNIYANQSSPVAGDYILGVGDEILIRAWGAVDIDLRTVIERNGTINIPRVGVVPLASVRAAEMENVLKGAISRVFRDFDLSVSLGQLRGITIYVVGQALRPGTYSVTGASTLVTALFASGGPNAGGSLRRVQLKRGGKLLAEMDLYAFLGKGDKSADHRLVDGDVIVIPPALGHVALTGQLNNPAIFELRSADDSLSSLLEIAGGLPVLADPRRVFLERIDARQNRPRSVEEFDLDAKGLAHTLKPGDLIAIHPITHEFSNAVTLRGSVNRPLRTAFFKGMRIADLIPNREFLISRHAVQRQNNALIAPNESASSFVGAVGNLYEDINWDYAVVERINRASVTSSLLVFDLGRALADPTSAENLALQAGDIVSVFSASDVQVPVGKRRVVVRIEGEVRRPGVYPVENGETLINLIEKAGGATTEAYLFGAEFYREAVRKSQQANLDKLIRQLEQQSTTELSRIAANNTTENAQVRLAVETESRNNFLKRLRELKASGRLSLGLNPQSVGVAQLPELRLENGDRLLIPARPDFIQIFGSVSGETAMLWRPGKSLSDYLAQAGVNREADKDATFVIRADGAVLSNSDRWFSRIEGIEALPGDIVVLPEKLDKESTWTAFVRGTKDITQILYNVGLGAAAVKTLRQ